MTEQFFQFIWEYQLFDSQQIFTTQGEAIEIVFPGIRNHDSGPDFSHARIRIGHTLWVGNVELHKQASDWYRHRHDEDNSYQNIILHVVSNADRAVKRASGEEIPTFEMRIRPEIIAKYEQLQTACTWIPCANSFHAIKSVHLEIGYSRLMTERLQYKTAEIEQRLAEAGSDWSETFYRLLVQNFGFKVNSIPFELLAKSLPYKIIARHADQVFQVEALLMGQSGLLYDQLLGDDYFLALREEHRFLAGKYHLRPLPAHLWKFLRLRPVNFPTIRMAQLAGLLVKSSRLFQRFTEIESLNEVREMLSCHPSDYWLTHYRFNIPAAKRKKPLGPGSIDNLIVNTLVPLLFLFGEHYQQPHLKERALSWLSGIEPEENGIIRKWRELGAHAGSMFETQALLQLKSRYCDERRCLECHVGYHILQRKDASAPSS